MINKIKFGKNLKKWMQGKGLRQEDLKLLIKVSQGSLSDVIRGKSLPCANTITNFTRHTDFPILEEFIKCQGGKK